MDQTNGKQSILGLFANCPSFLPLIDHPLIWYLMQKINLNNPLA